MAVSTSFSTSSQNIKYKITVIEGAADVVNNSSPVTVTVNFYRTDIGETYGTGTVFCKINGVTYSNSVTSNQKITPSGIDLFSKTVTISHNTDGLKTIPVSAWIDHSQLTSVEQGFNVVLSAIPRATVPTLSESVVDLGSEITITLNRASNTFTHKLYYAFGNLTHQSSGISDPSSAETSATFIPPLGLADIIPNATSGALTLTCETYDGSNYIGRKTVSIIVKVPASVVPVINSVTISEAVTSPDIAGTFNAFVQHKSKANVLFVASGSLSSTIKSCNVSISDANATETPLLAKYIVTDITSIETTGASITTDFISWDTTKIRISVTVIDSRGRNASVYYDKDVLAYSSPIISAFTAFRSDENGDPDDNSTNLKITLNFNIASVNNLNAKYYEILYKTKDVSSWQGTIVSGAIYSRNESFITSGITFDQNSAYDLRLNVYDTFDSASALRSVPISFTLVDFRSTGKGVAFGKTSEKDCIEIAMDVEITGKVIQENRITATLQNNWVNYESGYEVASFWKDSVGVVHLSGMIKRGTATAETTIFTLPQNYRPRATEKFSCVSVNSICVIDVYSSGNVTIKSGVNSGWLSLSGVSFRSA